MCANELTTPYTSLKVLSHMEWHARNLKTWRNLLSSLCVMILKCIIFTEQTLKCFNYRKILNLSCYSHFQYSWLYFKKKRLICYWRYNVKNNWRTHTTLMSAFHTPMCTHHTWSNRQTKSRKLKEKIL